MQELGRIVRLQVQLDSIKTGKDRTERYTPEPNLTSVPVLRLDADGVHGVTNNGELLPDVHNRTHPHSKFRGNNGLSICFTGHYSAMRAEYDDHLTDGIAGESVLVELDEIVSLDRVERGILITSERGGIQVGPWSVAHPCAPFAKFCMQFPDDAKPDRRITESLQFLENGMRGFTAVYTADSSPVEIRIGDLVYAIA